MRRTPVAGGSLNEAFRVEHEDGRPSFVKTRPDAGPAEFAAEAAALRWLGEVDGGVRVPTVLSVGEDHLELEWLEAGAVDDELLGRALARTHAAGAPGFGRDAPTQFGSLVLADDPAPDYATFLAERRLRPLARRLGGELQAAVERLCDVLPERLGPPEPPARVHGDLWAGNVVGAGRGAVPWVVDPAAHGGHREADLAMLRLFGGPGARCLAAYDEAHPLAPGHEERVALHQLTPLLVHAVLFGGGYGARALAIARRLA